MISDPQTIKEKVNVVLEENPSELDAYKNVSRNKSHRQSTVSTQDTDQFDVNFAYLPITSYGIRGRHDYSAFS